MKTVVICGSRNPEGRTAQAAAAVVKGLTQAGGSAEQVFLPALELKRCRQCDDDGWGRCRKEGSCVVEDDFGGLVDKIRQTDAVVFATAGLLCRPEREPAGIRRQAAPHMHARRGAQVCTGDADGRRVRGRGWRRRGAGLLCQPGESDGHLWIRHRGHDPRAPAEPAGETPQARARRPMAGDEARLELAHPLPRLARVVARARTGSATAEEAA